MSSTVSKSGVYNAICDRCGFKKKSTELFNTWDGYMVCKEDWEPKHPQLMQKPRTPRPALPWTRPDNTGG